MTSKNQVTYWILIAISLLFSGVAIFISTQKNKDPEPTVIEKTPEVLQKEKLDSVSKLITQTIEKEQLYQNVFYHPQATKTDITNAKINYKTQVAYALSIINKLLKKDEIVLLNSKMLIQYAKLENEHGDRKNAVDAYEHILKNSDHLIFKNLAVNDLALIYTDKSTLLYNPGKVRKFKKQIINTEKKFPSKDRYIRLAELYEEWAETECTVLNNSSYGNKVLDSAFYCVNKLPDYSPFKDSLLIRLKAMYKYHNHILSEKTVAGSYKFYENNVGKGVAKIAFNNNLFSIQIDYLENEKLMGQIKGTGNFTDPELLVFDVSFTSYSEKFETFKNGKGVVELKTEPNFSLKGDYKKFGDETIAIRLLKNTKGI